MAAAYGQRCNLRRHAEDLQADGALGLVEALKAGLTGRAVGEAVLRHVEASRLRAGPIPLSPEEVARHASKLATPEERLSAAELGERPSRNPVRRFNREIGPYLERLADDDRRLLRWYYKSALSQREIARRVGVTQVEVSRRLRLARMRLRFLINLPVLTADEVFSDLAPVLRFPRSGDRYKPIEALWLYYRTHSQSEAAEQLGVAQRRVRVTVLSAIRQLTGNRRLWRYRRALEMLMEQAPQKHRRR
jgi:RNA polymerase sigma factor (sigma-70 family)